LKKKETKKLYNGKLRFPKNLNLTHKTPTYGSAGGTPARFKGSGGNRNPPALLVLFSQKSTFPLSLKRKKQRNFITESFAFLRAKI